MTGTFVLFPGGIPGGTELIIILLIAVLLFGANKIPKLARSTGKALGEYKRGRQQIEEELEDLKEMPDEVKEVKGEVEEVKGEVEEATEEVTSEVEEVTEEVEDVASDVEEVSEGLVGDDGSGGSPSSSPDVQQAPHDQAEGTDAQ